MFAISTAKATPSGYPPQVLITKTKVPMKNPNNNLPLTVVEAVTGSVAMKNAPSIVAPEKRCRRGLATVLGEKR